MEQFDIAANDIEKAIELNQKNYKALVLRGYFNNMFLGIFSGCPYSASRYANAISDYTKAIELNPKYADAWYKRGSIKNHMCDYTGAIADLTEAIRLEPENEDYWNMRGWANELNGQLEEAIKDYRKAFEIDIYNELYRDNLRNAESKLAALNSKRAPIVHILAVGIGRYQRDFALSPLEFTVPGALNFEHLFERRGLVSHAPVLTDSKARRRAILDSLEALTNSKRVLPDDLVIFYFSGHGLLASGKLGICPYDYQTSADLIEDKTITEILNRCPARHKVCFIEACKNETSADVLDPVEVRRFNENRRSITSGIVYMTSTEVGKKSWGNADGGYFTVAIIEGLDNGKADANADRSVTAQELFDYVKNSVSSKTNSQQIPQINSGYPKTLELMELPK